MDQVFITLTKEELGAIISSAVSAAFERQKQLQGPEFYTASEVMALLNISRTTLHRLRKDGSIIGITINGHARFLKEEVDLFIQRRKEVAEHGQ